MGRPKKYNTEEERLAAKRLNYENWKLKKNLEALENGGEDMREYQKKHNQKHRNKNSETKKQLHVKIDLLETKVKKLTKLLEDLFEEEIIFEE